MLNGIAFASSLTILSAVSYMVLYLLAGAVRARERQSAASWARVWGRCMV